MRLVPDLPFLIIWAAFAIGGYFAAVQYTHIAWYVLLFVSINISTFFLYGLDKLLAAFQTRRVPERTLHLAAFLFGSPGALAAMQVFRHKTRKTSFQFVLAFLVLLQVLAVVGVFYYQYPHF